MASVGFEGSGDVAYAAPGTPQSLRGSHLIEGDPTREKHRITVNKWIRESGAFDGVADFDAALRDPEIPTQMRAVDDCGDGLHPSDSGYCKMGDAIDLALLD